MRLLVEPLSREGEEASASSAFLRDRILHEWMTVHSCMPAVASRSSSKSTTRSWSHCLGDDMPDTVGESSEGDEIPQPMVKQPFTPPSSAPHPDSEPYNSMLRYLPYPGTKGCYFQHRLFITTLELWTEQEVLDDMRQYLIGSKHSSKSYSTSVLREHIFRRFYTGVQVKSVRFAFNLTEGALEYPSLNMEGPQHDINARSLSLDSSYCGVVGSGGEELNEREFVMEWKKASEIEEKVRQEKVQGTDQTAKKLGTESRQYAASGSMEESDNSFGKLGPASSVSGKRKTCMSPGSVSSHPVKKQKVELQVRSYSLPAIYNHSWWLTYRAGF